MTLDKIKKNILWGFGGRFLIIILGFIVPHLMIKVYGSDINGLVSTISQIFTYMALLEAGIGQSARNALYKPFVNHDIHNISNIIFSAQCYYRRITILYGFFVFALSAILPFIIKSDISKVNIVLMVLFQGIANVISFYFIQTKTIVLAVDGKGYITQAATVMNKCITYLIQICMAYLGLSIIIIQISYIIANILTVIFFELYFLKKYDWIDWKNASNDVRLADRNSYVITELAWTIFSSTDMIILSIFLTTKLSSVYSIYSMIFTQLSSLLSSVYTNFQYILGKSYHQDIETYENIHDIFTSLCLGTMTIFVSVAYVLIIPFVTLYTSGVDDINYIYPYLPVMFCAIQLFSWSRMVTGHLTGVAGYAKNVSKVSLIEAAINIILSIVLVNFIGINGVTLATVIALPFKVVYCMYICDKKILKRSFKNSIVIMCGNYAVFFLSVLFKYIFKFKIASFYDFILNGVILLVIFLLLCIAVNCFCNKPFKDMILKAIKNVLRKGGN